MNVCLHGEILYKWIKKAKIIMNADCRLTDSWFIKRFFFFFSTNPLPFMIQQQARSRQLQGSDWSRISTLCLVFSLSLLSQSQCCCSIAAVLPLFWSENREYGRPDLLKHLFFNALLYFHTDYLLVMCIILKFSSCAFKMKIVFWGKKVMGHAEWKTFFIFSICLFCHWQRML